MLIKHESFDVSKRKKSLKCQSTEKLYESRQCPYLKYILIPGIIAFILTCILINVKFEKNAKASTLKTTMEGSSETTSINQKIPMPEIPNTNTNIPNIWTIENSHSFQSLRSKMQHFESGSNVHKDAKIPLKGSESLMNYRKAGMENTEDLKTGIGTKEISPHKKVMLQKSLELAETKRIEQVVPNLKATVGTIFTHTNPSLLNRKISKKATSLRKQATPHVFEVTPNERKLISDPTSTDVKLANLKDSFEKNNNKFSYTTLRNIANPQSTSVKNKLANEFKIPLTSNYKHGTHIKWPENELNAKFLENFNQTTLAPTVDLTQKIAFHQRRTKSNKKQLNNTSDMLETFPTEDMSHLRVKRQYLGAIKCQEHVTNCSLICTNGSLGYLHDELEALQKICQYQDLILHLSECNFYGGTLSTTFFVGEYSLKELHIVKCNLVTIKDGAFKKEHVQNLQRLELIDNKLAALNPGTFEGLTTLIQFRFSQQPLDDSLRFVGNQFLKPLAKTLKNATITQMADARVINNPWEWWQGTDFLSLVYMDLSNNNFLNILNEDTFVNLSGLKELVLQNCSLTRVDQTYFESLDNLEVVNLSHNLLTTLDIGFLEYVKEENIQLSMADNHWICNCSNKDMMGHLQGAKYTSEWEAEDFICHTPEEVQGESMLEIKLDCEPTTTITTTSTDNPSTTPTEDTTTLTTTGENLPNPSSPEEEDNITTTTIIAETEGDLIECSANSSPTCTSFAMKYRNAYLEITTLSDSSVTIKIQQHRDKLRLIFYTSISHYTNISLDNNLELIIDNLESGKAYVFCILTTKETTVSPFDCTAHTTLMPKKIWLSQKNMGWFIITVAMLFTFCFILGMVLVYCTTYRRLSKKAEIEEAYNKPPLSARLSRSTMNYRSTYLSPAAPPNVCHRSQGAVYDSIHMPPKESAPSAPNLYQEIPSTPYCSMRTKCHVSSTNRCKEHSPCLGHERGRDTCNTSNIYAVIYDHNRSTQGKRCAHQCTSRKCDGVLTAENEDIYQGINHYEAVDI